MLPDCPELQGSLLRFGQILTMQASQVAACNRMHYANERMARWLLISHDRLRGDSVPLTQEFLVYMLGTRRASVSMATDHLEKAGLLTRCVAPFMLRIEAPWKKPAATVIK